MSSSTRIHDLRCDLDAGCCAGITIFHKLCALAEAWNLAVTSHGLHDVSVRSYLEVHGASLDPFLRNPLAVRDGWVIAPERPGHGVELDWPRLDRHRVQSLSVNPAVAETGEAGP